MIEPRATYNYVTGIGTQFDRFIRFDDTDILSNTSELDISIANRILAKRGDNVSEIFSWELEQKRYFDPTFGGALVPGQANVFASTVDLSGYAFLVNPRSTSPVVSTLRLTPINGLSVQWQTDYDHRLHSIVNSAFSVDYTWKKYYHVSGGNSEVHSSPILTPAANQFRGRVWMGDTNKRGLNAGLDSIYDYQQGRMLWATAQVTYNTSCCGLSVQYRRIYRGPCQASPAEALSTIRRYLCDIVLGGQYRGPLARYASRIGCSDPAPKSAGLGPFRRDTGMCDGGLDFSGPHPRGVVFHHQAAIAQLDFLYSVNGAGVRQFRHGGVVERLPQAEIHLNSGHNVLGSHRQPLRGTGRLRPGRDIVETGRNPIPGASAYVEGRGSIPLLFARRAQADSAAKRRFPTRRRDPV